MAANTNEGKTLHFVYTFAFCCSRSQRYKQQSKMQQQNIGNDLSDPFAFKKNIVYCFAYCLITMENGKKNNRWLIQFSVTQKVKKYANSSMQHEIENLKNTFLILLLTNY